MLQWNVERYLSVIAEISTVPSFTTAPPLLPEMGGYQIGEDPAGSKKKRHEPEKLKTQTEQKENARKTSFKVHIGIEPISPESESDVLTITPMNQLSGF